MIETFKLLSSSLKPEGTSTSEGLGIADGEMEIIASDLSLLSRVQEPADRMSFTESSYRMGPHKEEDMLQFQCTVSEVALSIPGSKLINGAL
ncbi:hypothetical protein OIU85_009397 [Salix viminalis]|uniref:Uncharacterized protein n=1 Tax=Salix viminalis TaxID=40686 RepID=A0A9Q0NUF3_SALVM|nr:hypothetical protein OIU85_009397 [Salix viminalis]